MRDINQLGYLRLEVSDVEAWTRFGVDVLGLMAVEHDGGAALRLDSHPSRIRLVEGPADDLAALGWEVAGPKAMDAIVQRAHDGGHDVTEIDGDADRTVRLRDPGGNTIELYYGLAKAYLPFDSAHVLSGFVAEQLGLGHAVLRCEDKVTSLAFHTDVLGLGLSDEIICEIFGYPVDIAFLHANGRHHSMALGANLPKRIHHFMLEVGHVDDVGRCYDRAIRAGVPIVQTIGRHPNDKMISFYAETPSGFQFEVGACGRIIDPSAHAPTTYDHISEWGHHPPALVAKAGKKKERR